MFSKFWVCKFGGWRVVGVVSVKPEGTIVLKTVATCDTLTLTKRQGQGGEGDHRAGTSAYHYKKIWNFDESTEHNNTKPGSTLFFTFF